MIDSNNSLILHPVWQHFTGEITKLTEECTLLYTKRDEMLFQTKPMLSAHYMDKIGRYEVQTYQWLVKFRRLQRKLQLIQTRINRQELIILADIDRILDEELEQYQKELNRQIDQISNAEYYLSRETLGPEDTLRLREIYRSLVRALHPDLNPQQSSQDLNLFIKVVQTFKDGDWDQLEILAANRSQENFGGELSSIDALISRKEFLIRLIAQQKNLISELSGQHPFDKQALLANPQALQKRIEQIQDEMIQYQERYEWLKQQIEITLKGTLWAI